MKKLLVLALVLSMASMASAALVIGGAPVAPMQLTDTATLTITTDAILGYGLGDWNGWALVVPTAAGSITGGAVAAGAAAGEAGLSIQGTVAGAGMTDSMGTLVGQEGIAGTLNITGGNLPAATLLFDSLVFTPVAGGTTTISLYGTNDYDTFTFLTSVPVTVVPEPLTLGLLGLGGLFLRRRK